MSAKEGIMKAVRSDETSTAASPVERYFGIGFVYTHSAINYVNHRPYPLTTHRFDIIVLPLYEYPNLSLLSKTLFEEVSKTIPKLNTHKEKILDLKILSVFEFGSKKDLDTFIAQPDSLTVKPMDTPSPIIADA